MSGVWKTVFPLEEEAETILKRDCLSISSSFNLELILCLSSARVSWIIWEIEADWGMFLVIVSRDSSLEFSVIKRKFVRTFKPSICEPSFLESSMIYYRISRILSRWLAAVKSVVCVESFRTVIRRLHCWMCCLIWPYAVSSSVSDSYPDAKLSILDIRIARCHLKVLVMPSLDMM